jgi:hypothetical protein
MLAFVKCLSKTRQAKRARPRAGFRRPWIERLEERIAPAFSNTTFTWIGAGQTRLWSDPANWTRNNPIGSSPVPSNGDTVIFDPSKFSSITSRTTVPILSVQEAKRVARTGELAPRARGRAWIKGPWTASSKDFPTLLWRRSNRR